MREIVLTRGLAALVDDEDYERLAVHKWHAVPSRNTFYARRTSYDGGKKVNVYLHRAVLELLDGWPLADHRDGNGLNCCRQNLRTGTVGQNLRNQQPRNGRRFKGIYRHGRRWSAQIWVTDHFICLGEFATETEAALAWDNAARLYHGEFARLNFPVDADVLHASNLEHGEAKCPSTEHPEEFFA